MKEPKDIRDAKDWLLEQSDSSSFGAVRTADIGQVIELMDEHFPGGWDRFIAEGKVEQ